DPRTISYIETGSSGSASALSIELAALSKVFGNSFADTYKCAVGSVQSNIGHAVAATGVCQLIKVSLQIAHQQLIPEPRKLAVSSVFNNLPFCLTYHLQTWKRQGNAGQAIPRRAMINCFGLGGSSVNVILEEYIPAQQTGLSVRLNVPQVIVLSAKNDERLRLVAQRLLEHVKATTDLSLSDCAYPLQIGREAMNARLALIVKNRTELIDSLSYYLRPLPDSTSATIFTGTVSSLPNAPSKGAGTEAQLTIDPRTVSLHELAISWTGGAQIQWQLLHEGQQKRRICLPTYPFSKSPWRSILPEDTVIPS